MRTRLEIDHCVVNRAFAGRQRSFICNAESSHYALRQYNSWFVLQVSLFHSAYNIYCTMAQVIPFLYLSTCATLMADANILCVIGSLISEPNVRHVERYQLLPPPSSNR